MPFEAGIAILDEGKQLAILVSNYAAKVSDTVGFRYYEPRGIQDLIKEGYGSGEKEKGERQEARSRSVIRMEKAG